MNWMYIRFAYLCCSSGHIWFVTIHLFDDSNGRKARILTNEICMGPCLLKKSVADCLQTRPIDHRHRLVRILGKLSHSKILEINQALLIVFELKF